MTAKKTNPGKRGRKSKYEPAKHCKMAARLAEAGMVDKEIAEFLGITEATLNNWKKDYPEFLESLKGGKKAPDGTVKHSLYTRATGYAYEETKEIRDATGNVIKTEVIKKQLAPDVTACMFWLQNRLPEEWRDRRYHELTGKGGGPIETKELPASDIEIAKYVAFALSRSQVQKQSEKIH